MNQLSFKTIRVELAILSAMAVVSTAGAADLSKLPPASHRTDVSYEKDIKPLFEASCVRCHGPERPKAGLRLDSLEAVLKGSKEGKVLEVGKSDKSSLVIAVSHIDPELAMPPKPRPPRPNAQAAPAPGGTNAAPRAAALPPPKPLTPEQVGLVRAWIDHGAK
jgi:mono/diheme cytochrome c family protein